MTLTTQTVAGLGDVSFDTDVFSAEDMAGIAALIQTMDDIPLTPDAPMMADLAPEPTEPMTPAEAVAEIRRQIEAGEFMPDMMAEAETELGRPMTADEILDGVLEATELSVQGQMMPEVLATLETNRTRVTVENGTSTLWMDDAIVIAFEAPGPLAALSARTLAIIKMVIDVAQLILAFVNYFAPKDQNVVKGVTQVVEKKSASAGELASALLSIFKDIINTIQAIKDKEGRLAAITNLAVDIGKALFLTLKYLWSAGWAIFADTIKVFVAKRGQRIKACASLAASILAWAASAGAVLVGSIIGAAVTVCDLIEDFAELKAAK